jgi:2-isopropylmalate synthase
MHSKTTLVQATVEVRIGIECIRRSATGVGPVHALDTALRACLLAEFPELGPVHLSDYKVTVVDATEGTGAQVRVLIQASDETGSWDVGCVSENIVDASFEALCSATVVGIMRGRAAKVSA